MSSLPNLDNASRNAAEIGALGPFAQRRLADELQKLGFNLWTNQATRATFLTADPVQRGAVIAAKLAEYDAKKGAEGASAAPATPEAPAAETAPAPPPTASKRAPRTTPAAAVPPAGGNVTPSAAAPGVQDLLLAIKDVKDQLGTFLTSLDASAKTVSGLTGSVGGNQTSLNEIKKMLGGVVAIQHVQLGILCLFGQQVLGGATVADIIGPAGDEADAALALLEELAGKG